MYLVPFIISSLCLTTCLGLSSKLDFGDDSTASIITQHQNNKPVRRQEEYEIIKKESSNDDNGLICSKGGCNSTNTKNKPEVVNTDVVVQVKTSINVKNSTAEVGDVPDVPVVLGTNGAGFKNTQEYRTGLHYQPLPPKHLIDRNSPPVVVTNIEDIFPSTAAKFTPVNVYKSKNENDIDMNIKFSSGLPMITLSLPDGYQYKTKGVEVKVPYFETAYHKHYFGENSPPQIAYHLPKGNVYNPVAFNNIARPAYSFTNWQNRIPSVQGNDHKYYYGGNCNNCPNVVKHTTGLHWYPSNRNNNKNVPATVPAAGNHFYVSHRRVDGNADPGSQINDKLAPLND